MNKYDYAIDYRLRYKEEGETKIEYIDSAALLYQVLCSVSQKTEGKFYLERFTGITTEEGVKIYEGDEIRLYGELGSTVGYYDVKGLVHYSSESAAFMFGKEFLCDQLVYNMSVVGHKE